MESRLKGAIESLVKPDSRIKIIIALGLISVILIVLSEVFPAQSKKSNEEVLFDAAAYTDALEEKTADMISSVNGAGRCRVMITLKVSEEKRYAVNSSENSDESSNSRQDEYVLYNGQDGEEPLLIKQYFPEVQGVAVVCDGAENTVVREQIITMVSALYNLSVSKISVTKLKG